MNEFLVDKKEAAALGNLSFATHRTRGFTNKRSQLGATEIDPNEGIRVMGVGMKDTQI